MSIEQEAVIDILGSNTKPNEVLLIITDHLQWGDDDYEHAVKLQNKLNNYLAFIQDGQMDDEYPEHRGKLPVIKVIGKYPLNSKGGEFYEKAVHVVAHEGILLVYEHKLELPEDTNG